MPAGQIYLQNAGVALPVTAGPLGALQNALADSGNTAPYYIIGILALFGLILGRTICGFAEFKVFVAEKGLYFEQDRVLLRVCHD